MLDEVGSCRSMGGLSLCVLCQSCRRVTPAVPGRFRASTRLESRMCFAGGCVISLGEKRICRWVFFVVDGRTCEVALKDFESGSSRGVYSCAVVVRGGMVRRWCDCGTRGRR